MRIFKTLLFLLLCIFSKDVFSQYNFYFGNLHSHSSYSDGNKDSTASGYYYPGDDYNYVKGSYHMDYLGISDHNHFSSVNNPGMHVEDYAKGIYQADTANKEGTFVCMYGFEWGVISSGGHVVSYGIPGLVGWETGSGTWGPTNNYDIFCAKNNYTNFWPIVNSYPNAFSTLAHPQTGDYSDLAGAAPYSTPADNAIVGVAVRSGAAFSTTTNYTDPAPTLYDPVYFSMLAKGYHLGPNEDQDNHYSTFGRTGKFRTVVLATSLKRDSIITAYRAMRFYASDDWNAQVTFTVNGNYMGSTVSTNSNSAIYVSVADADGASDPTNTIDIYYGIPGSGSIATLLTSSSNSELLNFSHPTAMGDNYYYFAKITQADGNMIWTAPVWISRISVLAVETQLSGLLAGGEALLSWYVSDSLNNDLFEVERSEDGIHFNTLGSVLYPYSTSSTDVEYKFTDKEPRNGVNFYRLKQVRSAGNIFYSNIIALRFDDPVIDLISINPNPVSNFLNILCTSREATSVSFKFYTSEGRIVRDIQTRFSKGSNTLTSDVSSLSPGVYFVVLSRPNERITEGKFVKQ